MFWTLIGAFAALPSAGLYAACERGDVSSCKSFLAADARAWLRSEARDPLVKGRWQSLLSEIWSLKPCEKGAEYAASTCRDVCRGGARAACETLATIRPLNAEALVEVQRLCDDGYAPACAAIRDHGVAAIDGLGDGSQASRAHLTSDGALVERGYAGVSIVQRNHLRLSMAEGSIDVRRDGGDWTLLELEDRIIGGPPITPDRVWERPLELCEHATLTDDDRKLLVVAGPRCDHILRYDANGGPVEATLELETVIDGITAGPEGGMVVRQSGAKGIRSLTTAGEELWAAAAKDGAGVRASVAAGKLVSSNHYQCAVHDLKTGALLEEAHGACDIDGNILAVASGRGQVEIRDLAGGKTLEVPMAGMMGSPHPVVDAKNGRVAVPGGPIVTLKGGVRPRTDALGRGINRYERARTKVEGVVTNAGTGLAATVEVYLVVGDLDEPKLSLVHTVQTSAEGGFTAALPVHRPTVLRATAGDRSAFLWWAHDAREKAELDLAVPGVAAPVTFPCGPGCPEVLETLPEQVSFFVNDEVRYRELVPLPVPVHSPMRADADLYFEDEQSHHIDLYFGRRVARDGHADPGEKTIDVVDATGAPVQGMPVVCEDVGVRYSGRTDANGQFRSGSSAQCGLAPAVSDVAPWLNALSFATRMEGTLAPMPQSLKLPHSAAIATDLAEFESFDALAVVATGPWTTPDGEVATLTALYGEYGEPKTVAPGVLRLSMRNPAYPSLQTGAYLVFDSDAVVWVVPAPLFGGEPVKLERVPN